MSVYTITCGSCGANFTARGITLRGISDANDRAAKAGWDTANTLCPSHAKRRTMNMTKLHDDAAAAAKADGLPEEFVRTTEKPAAKAKREASAKKQAERIAKATAEQKTADQAKAEELKAEVAKEKATKATNRKATKAAVAAGETKRMPATGHEAVMIIKGARKAAAKADKAAEKAAGAPKAAKGAKTKAAPAKRTSAPRKPGTGSKTELIGALLKRAKGCTTKDVLEATGWPAVSMPQQAKALGIGLRKEKKPGEVTRYFAA